MSMELPRLQMEPITGATDSEDAGVRPKTPTNNLTAETEKEEDSHVIIKQKQTDSKQNQE
jgi:hypothetical protein